MKDKWTATALQRISKLNVDGILWEWDLVNGKAVYKNESGETILPHKLARRMNKNGAEVKIKEKFY